MKRLHIGIVTGYLPSRRLGGAQLQAVKMARALAEKHEVTLFARGKPADLEGLDLEGVRIRLREPPEIPWLRLLLDIRAGVRTIADLEPRPEVLVCYQTLVAGLIGVSAKQRLGIPTVTWIRGRHETRRFGWTRHRFLVPRVLARSDRVFVQARALGEEVKQAFSHPRHALLQRRLQERIRVLANGVTLQPQRSGTGSHLVFIGRLVALKRIPDILEALRTLPQERLVIVGDGPDRAALERSAVDRNVDFIGRVPASQVTTYLERAKCLVLASETEAFPNVILEAMALGVPVVAPAVGGIPDLIEPGKTGYLFPVGDVQALRKAIERIVCDPLQQQAMGDAAYRACKAYDWPNAANSLARELRALVDQPHHSHRERVVDYRESTHRTA